MTCVGNVSDHITDKITGTSEEIAVTSGNVAGHDPQQDHRYRTWRRTPRARRPRGGGADH